MSRAELRTWSDREVEVRGHRSSLRIVLPLVTDDELEALRSPTELEEARRTMPPPPIVLDLEAEELQRVHDRAVARARAGGAS